MLNSRINRGQVTLFVVLAIVLVAVVVVVYLFAPRVSDVFMGKEDAQKILASEVEPLKDYVSKCVEETSINFFRTAGMQGGYYDNSHLSTIFYTGYRTVILYKNEDGDYVNVLPGLTGISGEFNDYMVGAGGDYLDTCLDDFASFKRIMDVEAGARSITADAETSEGSILINVAWPITIKKAGASTTVEPRNTKISVNLKNVFRVANDIITKEIEGNFINSMESYIRDHPDLLSEITIGAADNNPRPNQKVYTLTTTYMIGEEPYLFYFAVDKT